MPGPTSSNDLILELMRDALNERARDQADGLTLRSLDRRLEKHEEFDREEFAAITEALGKLREKAARMSGHADAMDTGSFHIPPVAINVGEPKHSKRPSVPPWLKTASKPILHWVGMILIVTAYHLLQRCGIQTPMPPPPASTQPSR
jgi:hypothetical protein